MKTPKTYQVRLIKKSPPDRGPWRGGGVLKIKLKSDVCEPRRIENSLIAYHKADGIHNLGTRFDRKSYQYPPITRILPEDQLTRT